MIHQVTHSHEKLRSAFVPITSQIKLTQKKRWEDRDRRGGRRMSNNEEGRKAWMNTSGKQSRREEGRKILKAVLCTGKKIHRIPSPGFFEGGVYNIYLDVFTYHVTDSRTKSQFKGLPLRNASRFISLFIVSITFSFCCLQHWVSDLDCGGCSAKINKAQSLPSTVE